MLSEYLAVEFDLINGAAAESELQPYLHPQTRVYAKNVLREVLTTLLNDIHNISQGCDRIRICRADLDHVIASYALTSKSVYSEINFEEYKEDDDSDEDYDPDEEEQINDEDDESLGEVFDELDETPPNSDESAENSPNSISSREQSTSQLVVNSEHEDNLSPDSNSSTDSDSFETKFQNYLNTIMNRITDRMEYEVITALTRFVRRQLVLSFGASPHSLFTRMGYSPLGLLNYYYIYTAPIVAGPATRVTADTKDSDENIDVGRLFERMEAGEKLLSAELKQSEDLSIILKEALTPVAAYQPPSDDDASNPLTARKLINDSPDAKDKLRRVEQLQLELKKYELERNWFRKKYVELQLAVEGLHAFSTKLKSVEIYHDEPTPSSSTINTPLPKYHQNEDDEDDEVARNTTLNKSTKKSLTYSKVGFRRASTTFKESNSGKNEDIENIDPKGTSPATKSQAVIDMNYPNYNIYSVNNNTSSSNQNLTSKHQLEAEEYDLAEADELDRLIHGHNEEIALEAALSKSASSSSSSGVGALVVDALSKVKDTLVGTTIHTSKRKRTSFEGLEGEEPDEKKAKPSSSSSIVAIEGNDNAESMIKDTEKNDLYIEDKETKHRHRGSSSSSTSDNTPPNRSTRSTRR